MKNTRLAIFVSLFVCGQVNYSHSQTITGAGSSAAAPIYKSWALDYQKATGAVLVYEPIGSSAGLKKIRANETGFGASDVAPSDAELAKDGLIIFPVAVTGIAPVVNLPKIGEDQLRLTGDILARIFLGEITKWNAPEIATLNPTRSLPDAPIQVVVRGDGSGTTYNFADYLAKMNPVWKSRYGVKTSFDWPANFIAVKGSGGMAKAVKETVGSIGYVDYGYVKENMLTAVSVMNADGEFTKPSISAFRKALLASEWASKGAFTTTLTNQPGKDVWPIAMGTFVVMPRVADKREQSLSALKFFAWAFLNGDALVQANNFVRLPDKVQALAFKAIASVRDKEGQPIGMGTLGGGTGFGR
jgi:phosphate transport system substrate-binding protein